MVFYAHSTGTVISGRRERESERERDRDRETERERETEKNHSSPTVDLASKTKHLQKKQDIPKS